MVKGTTKQVVLVKPAGNDLFEQAIFIVKEGAGVSPEQVMDEANRAAKVYVRGKTRGGRGAGTAWLPLLTFLAGGGLSTLLWWIL